MLYYNAPFTADQIKKVLIYQMEETYLKKTLNLQVLDVQNYNHYQHFLYTLRQRKVQELIKTVNRRL